MTRQKRILAIASGGGHWIQLFRMRPAFDGHRLVYASTMQGMQATIADDAKLRGQAVPEYVELPEANRWQKMKMAILLVKIALLLLRVRPHFIISTGAAHGYFAIRIGKLIGARTIWIDSFANAEEMSMSGRLIKPHASHCLSQWPDVARATGAEYHGAVL